MADKYPYLASIVTKALADHGPGMFIPNRLDYLKDKLSLDVTITEDYQFNCNGNIVSGQELEQLIRQGIYALSVDDVAIMYGDLFGYETEVDPSKEYILY